MIYLAKTPTFVNKLFPSYNWKISKHPKCLYLTFDDGPIAEITPWVLDTLKDFNAKATFFCIGENVKNNPSIFKRIIDDHYLKTIMIEFIVLLIRVAYKMKF